MDREWTYRPPLLVGERVVWLGGAAGIGETDPCDYGPHHGTVSWIGRVPDMGLNWIVGAEFEVDMNGGCNGAWKGRHIFTCKPGHGLFLPVSSLIREDDFYGKQSLTAAAQSHLRTATASRTPTTPLSLDKPLDISLSPEPPPPRLKSTSPTDEIPTQIKLKHSGQETDASVCSVSSAICLPERILPKHLQQSKDKGSSSFSTSVVISSTSSSSATTTSTTIYTSSVCSSTAYTSKDLVPGNFTHNMAQDTSHDKTVRQGKILASKDRVAKDLSNKSVVSHEYEAWLETGGEFGDTMIKKSTMPSSNKQSSISVPSSPSLSDYQKSFASKSYREPHSSLANFRKSSSLSGYTSDKSQLHREKSSSGFFNIFRWFRNRDRKKRSTSIDRTSTNSGGSTSSLTSATSSFAYIPIMRSKSADIQKKMLASKRTSEFGLSSKYRPFSKESSLETIIANMKDEELSKRLSTISASSDSSKGGLRSTTGRKKRPAPQPPGSPKTSECSSLKSQKSCTSLPSTELSKPAMVAVGNMLDSKYQVIDGRKLRKSKSEGLICSKTKRRAPLPPIHLLGDIIMTENQDRRQEQKDVVKKRKAPPVPAKLGSRPLSNMSNLSSQSQSPSSASTTLRSQSSSIASSETFSSPYSTESFRLESGYLKQEIKSTSSPSIPEASKSAISPRPWYKRKKKQNKDNVKDLKDNAKKERIYESWMPDIQFSRSKLNLSGNFRLGKYSGLDDETLRKSKDEKKEKRKSQLSLLANISELDRAASEQMLRDQEEKKAKKDLYDSKFYKSSEPHILTQLDFLPGVDDHSNVSTLSSPNTNASPKSFNSRLETIQRYSYMDGVYDNIESSEGAVKTFVNCTNQATLKINDNDILPTSAMTADQVSSVSGSQKLNISTDSESDITSNIVALEPSLHLPARESPMHRATFDAELFYKLAKETQGTSNCKLKSSALHSGTRNKQMDDNDQASRHESVLSQFRRHSKNFGLRMNNFFSPDVSTIIEASESMTSSATTPADDIYEDLPVSASVDENLHVCSTNEELHSELNYEFRLNTSEAREIMKELADVRQEIAKINQEEEEAATKNMEKKKADKIREEILLLRKSNNFQLWQDIMSKSNSQEEESTPLPIEIENSERKLKWICDVCTLINLPWRLQCEACMMRRPSNPRRVEEEGNASSLDHTSSQQSASNESPITVIHEDDNRDGSKNANDADTVSPNEMHHRDGAPRLVDGKKTRDINWEHELRKYFTAFDEHVKSVNEATELCREQKENKSYYRNISDSEGQYGKINMTSITPIVTVSDSTACDTKLKTEASTSSNEKLGLASKIVNAPKDYERVPNLDELRKARTAKFVVSKPSDNSESSVCPNNGDGNNINKSTKKSGIERKKTNLKGKKSKSLDHEYCKEFSNNSVEKAREYSHLTLLTDNSSGTANDQSGVNVTSNEQDKTFYSRNYRKPQLMKPSGVVNSVISIFNQREQLQQAKTEKPKITRRRSFSSIIGRTQAFEQINSQSNSPELPRSQNFNRQSPKFTKKNDIMRDKDIETAIAKFDEMAALAEVDRIEKQRFKSEMAKRKPKLPTMFSKSKETANIFSNNTKSTKTNHINGFSNGPQDSSSHPLFNCNRQFNGHMPNRKPHGDHNSSPVHSVESTDSIIKDGVLYTEQRKRSLSIGSGTFELMQAKDFESIEAQHSERSSPIEANKSIINSVSSSEIDALVSVPQIIIDPGQDASMPASNLDNNIASLLKMRDNHSQADMQEVERLSRQLTVADGIATFKATLKVEEPNLGQMNTLNINRLLRRLEAAISCGNHAEAAKLAHELAELRVSCSVIRNTKSSKSSRCPNPATVSDDKELCITSNEGDHSRSFTPSSSVSECFYDACEKLDNEEDSTNSEADELHLLSSTSELENVPSGSSSDVASASLQTSTTVNALSCIHEATTSTCAPVEGEENRQDAPKGSMASMREVKIDPARREVKSDTISQLPNDSKLSEKGNTNADLPFNVKMYVEDKSSHQGPITFSVVASMTVGELREKVSQDFGFPPEVQRWILGRRLADNDHHTLSQHKVVADGCPIFLYLVAPDCESNIHGKVVYKAATDSVNHYHAQNGAYSRQTSSNENSTVSSTADSVNRSPTQSGAYTRQASNHETSAVNSSDVNFYNPETKTYEVSIDTAYSGINVDICNNNDEKIMIYDNHLYQNIKDSHGKIMNVSESSTENLNVEENVLLKKGFGTLQPHLQNTSQISIQNPIADASFEKYKDIDARHLVETYSMLANSQQNVNEQKSPSSDCKANTPESVMSGFSLNLNMSVEQGNETSTSLKVNEPNLPQSPIESPQDNDYQGIPENVIENLHHQKQGTLPELQKQKRLILELQHQQHYAQVQEVQHVPPQCNTSTLQETIQHPLPQASTVISSLEEQQQDANPPDHIRNDLLDSSCTSQATVMQSYQQPPDNCESQFQSNHTDTAKMFVPPADDQVPSNLSLKEPLQRETVIKTLSGETLPKVQQQQLQKVQNNVSTQIDQDLSKRHVKQHKQSQTNQRTKQKGVQRQPTAHLTHQTPAIAEKPGKEVSTMPLSPKAHGWVCPSCTFVNKWERPGCEVCATERPGSQHSGVATANVDKAFGGIGAVLSVLDRQGYVPNQEPFECCICFMNIEPGDGAVLRDCLHTFCKDCLSNAVKYSETAEVKCPYRDNQYSCDFSLQDREIKALLSPQAYEKHLNKSVKQAEGAMHNVFHCKTPDCPGFCQYEDNVNFFHCDVCKNLNCLTCQAQHEGKTCQEYQDDLAQKVDEAAMKTKKFFDDMIRRGDGLPCPKCSVMLVRKWGCDWMRCPMCRTEICWVTRGPRWGPGGPGDISGGCKCGVRGQKCHPKCTYCH